MRKQLKQQEQSQSAIALEIAPAGIEPTSKVPETFVLSIERRSRRNAGIVPRSRAHVKLIPTFFSSEHTCPKV